MNPYQVLGLPKTATLEEVKTAYRRLAKQYHPDLNKTNDAEARMKQINEAYDMIMKGWKPEIFTMRVTRVWYYPYYTGTSTTSSFINYF